MDARVADRDLAIPDRQSDEPEASPNQKAKLLELGLNDSRLVGRLGKWQANAILDQLRARWLAEQEAQRVAQQRRRRARRAKIVMGLLGLSAALGLYLRFA